MTADFGIVKKFADLPNLMPTMDVSSNKEEKKKDDEDNVGTPLWMAPEVIKNEPYSLNVIIYLFIT